eukprot:1145584-Pelagomonas_calceolata.AAC.3
MPGLWASSVVLLRLHARAKCVACGWRLPLPLPVLVLPLSVLPLPVLVLAYGPSQPPQLPLLVRPAAAPGGAAAGVGAAPAAAAAHPTAAPTTLAAPAVLPAGNSHGQGQHVKLALPEGQHVK